VRASPLSAPAVHEAQEIALFEVVREDRKANEQQHQVGEPHEDELVEQGRGQAGERPRWGTVVEDRDTATRRI
jgi:hypothetical protein